MTASPTERAVTHALLAIFALMAIAPLVGVLLMAFNGSSGPISGFQWPEELSLEPFRRAWDVANLTDALAASALVASVTVVLTVTLSVLAGFAFGALEFPGRNVLFGVLLVGLVIPSEAMVIPLYYDVNEYLPFLKGSYVLVALVETARFVAFGTFWMRAFFAAVPRSLIDAATLDGANPLTTLRRVLLAPARPAILTLAVFVFLWSWNEFLLALVLLSASPGRQTAPLALALFTGQHSTDVAALAAASLVVAAPVVLLYLLFQRQFIRGVLAGGMKA